MSVIIGAPDTDDNEANTFCRKRLQERPERVHDQGTWTA